MKWSWLAERCPHQFKQLGVVDYANSIVASFEQDLLMFANCGFAITAGSGIAFLPDCMGKQYLYLNSWHIPMQMPSKKCLSFPTRVKNRKTDKFLTMVEQSNLYVSLADIGQEVFPESDYEAMNATSDDMFLGYKGDAKPHRGSRRSFIKRAKKS